MTAEAEPGVLRRARRGPRRMGAVAGGSIVIAYLLVALLAPLIAPADPLAQDISSALSSPSPAHPFGTDNLGRDALSRLLFGARIDLFLGVVSVICSAVIGSTLGLIAGYANGVIDAVLSRIMDVFQTLPSIVLLIVLLLLFGSSPLGILVALVSTSWVAYARIVRAQVLVVTAQDYTAAARLAGLGVPRVLVRHVLPNVWKPAFVYMTSDIAMSIGAIAALGYLGIGIQPPTPEWGQIIAAGQPFLTRAPWLTVIPGLCIVGLGLGLSLVADSLSSREGRRRA